MTFTEASQPSAPRARLMDSFPKAEKVVNPPRTPTTMNARVSAVKAPLDSARYDTSPTAKHPMTLTTSVP